MGDDADIPDPGDVVEGLGGETVGPLPLAQSALSFLPDPLFDRDGEGGTHFLSP